MTFGLFSSNIKSTSVEFHSYFSFGYIILPGLITLVINGITSPLRVISIILPGPILLFTMYFALCPVANVTVVPPIFTVQFQLVVLRQNFGSIIQQLFEHTLYCF